MTNGVLRGRPDRVLLLLASLTSAGVALAGAYSGQVTTDWVSYNASYDGDFSDVNHWQASKGFPADNTFRANFVAPASGSGYTVTFTGAITNSAPVWFNAGSATTTTVSGVGASWTMPTGASDIYPADPLSFKVSGYPFVCLTFDNTSGYALSPFRFEDFRFRMESDATKKNLSLVCERGTYNFYDPEGFPRAKRSIVGLSTKDNIAASSATLAFEQGATLRAHSLHIQPNNYTNTVSFAGGSHLIASDISMPGSVGSDTSTSRATLSVIRLSDDASLTVGSVVVGNNSTARKRYGFVLDDSSLSLTKGLSFAARGDFFIDARNGSTVELTGGVWQFTKANGCNTAITVDGSTFRSTVGWSLGPIDNTVTDSTCTFAATNSFVDQRIKTTCSVNGNASLEFVDCVWSNNCDFSYGYAALPGTVSRVTLKGNASRSIHDNDLLLGRAAGATGEFRIEGGVHHLRHSTGVCSVGHVSGATGVVSVAGGDVTMGTAGDKAKVVRIGNTAGSAGFLNLTGGTLRANRLCGGSGTSRLYANGGTFVALASSSTIDVSTIDAFSDAVLEGDGLTVDTAGFNITLDQDFTGTGPLVLTGGGEVTIAAGRSIAGGVVVRGGTSVVFAGAASLGGSLVLGADGTTCPITIPYGATLAVGGDIEASSFSIAFSGGTYGKADGPSTIFRATGSLVGDTADRWLYATVRSGVSSDGSVGMTVGADGKSLVLEVRDSITVTLSVAAGETASTNSAIKMAAGDTLVFDIGDGGAFSSEFPITHGIALVKRGSGTLTLSNPGNDFASVTNEAGTIVLKHPNALGGAVVPISGAGIVYDFDEPGETASTFIVAKAQSNETVHVDIAGADVATPLYDILNGGIVKDGPGAVSFIMPDVNVRLSSTSAAPWKGNKRDDAGFAIRQGEVAFRGRTGAIRELVYAYMGLKIGVDDVLGVEAPVPPTIVFDHVKFEAAGLMLRLSETGRDPSAGEPTLVATNHANVIMNSLYGGSGRATESTANSHIVVDDGSTFRIINYLALEPDAGNIDFVVDNCSTVVVSTTSLRGNLFMTFRNGSCLVGDSGACALNYGVASHETAFRFESGSELQARYVGEIEPSKTSLASRCAMTFAGGSWNPRSDTFTFDFKRIDGSILVEGEGLVLSPEAGQTWTLGVPVADSPSASGGLVKRGAGTVVLDAANKAYTGATSVEAGVLDMNGSTWHGAEIGAGAGLIANGTLQNAKISLDVEDGAAVALPNFAADCSFAGRTIVDLSDANLPLGATLAVATYSGSAPDVSTWRLAGNGDTAGRFTASAGTVTAEVVQKSRMMLIIR